ncbi:GAF domain-containing protein (plasmid) [Kitasatospora sp. NBC_00070]|uniref:GAF domain-containing protein n=1 Tax=Kitasatospora sp. NBC_00070 TaxID=2975962 RepID=UPI002F911518
MTGDRLGEALRLLQLHDLFQEVPEVTVACTDALEMDGLALSLVTGGTDTELLWCSEAARDFEDLQFTIGHGPEPDTVRTKTVQWVPDWDRVRPGRWPALTSQAVELQARAVFCFPLAAGTHLIGVLTTVRRTPGPLTARQADNAWMLAAALTARYLNIGEAPLERPGRVLLHRRLVHQASGMAAAQLDIPPRRALLQLRVLAFSSGRPLIDICQEVLDRRLRLDHSDN